MPSALVGGPNANADILRTLEAYKQAVAPLPGQGMLSPDAAKAWNVASGFQAYNLEALHSLYPVLTPVRNMTSRVKGKGKKVEYKAVTALNTAGLQGWVAEGSAASIVSTTTTDVTATYKSFALGDTVTFEAQWAGVGFTDVKALSVVNLLRATMIAEENAMLFGQVNGSANATEQAPGAVGAAPAPTAADSGSGSSNFAATTYYVFETVITGMGESLPSTGTSVSMTAGHNLTVTPVAPSPAQPVLGYRIYVGTSSTASAAKLVAAAGVSGGLPTSGSLNGIAWTTNGQAVTLTAIPTGAAPPASDGSASANAYNGIYTQMVGGSGATLTALNGTLTNTALQNMFTALWNSAKGDPDMVLCNVQESTKITSLTLGNGTPYQVLVNQGEVANASANFRVARYTNPATGSEVPIKVHPTVPQGTMLFLQSKLPSWYVPTDIPTVWEWDGPQDYVEIDYPPTSGNPLWQVEVRYYGAMKLYIPALQGALTGINNS